MFAGFIYPQWYQVPVVKCESLPVPEEPDTSFKAWMDYRAITDETSKQWALQQDAVTDENGFRKLDGKYMVAAGTYYAEECGDILVVLLENGTYFEAIVSDIKQNVHTDAANMYSPVSESQGNVVEFIVDKDQLHEDALILGDVSVAGLQGKVITILKLTEKEKGGV